MKVVMLERSINGEEQVTRLQAVIDDDPSRIVSKDGITLLGVIIHEE